MHDSNCYIIYAHTGSYLGFNVPLQHKYGYIRDELILEGNAVTSIAEIWTVAW